MTDVDVAVAEYLRRESAAMATPQGADHVAIMEAVAGEYGIDVSVLSGAVIDQTVTGPN